MPRNPIVIYIRIRTRRKMKLVMNIIVMRLLMLIIIFVYLICPIIGVPLVPALYVFGDSLMDSGNNNFLPTSAKANYLPYGSNFPHGPTGRFTNGRTAADFIAEYLGLPYPPPYLSLHGQMSLSGINYASGSCGILPESGALLGKCKSLSEQINLFEWTVETNLGVKLKNRDEKSHHLSKSIYLVAVGSNDYINNYLETKFDTSKRYHPQTFAHLLIHNLSQQFQRLYKLGARKIVMFEIGPLGCLPSISKTHLHKGNCLEETNQIVSYFNEMLPSMLNNLTFTLPHSFFVLGRINSKVYDAATNPTTYGLTDPKTPCCRTWENASAVCIPLTIPCINPFQHIFWDGYHLTEPLYSFLASQCLHGDSLCTPLNIQQLVKM